MGITQLQKLFALVTIPLLLHSCGLAKAVEYSFYVPEHGDHEIEGHCYGVEDQPGERLLITDCGGYMNVLASTFTLGLSTSSEATVFRYTNAAKNYIQSNYGACEIDKINDLGGRIFEVHYRCINSGD